MEVQDYKSNSHKSKEAAAKSEKRVEKAIVGTASTRKKSDLRKFTDVFVSEDVENVKSYILLDVIVPAIKKAIVDVVSDGINMLMYGESGSRGSKSTTASTISYQNYYDSRSANSQSYSRPRANTSLDYEDITFENRGDAESVLARMDELIDQYGVVSVGDLYDLAGLSTDNYTINRYGWTNIRNASVVRVRDGYVIKMPKPMPID